MKAVAIEHGKILVSILIALVMVLPISSTFGSRQVSGIDARLSAVESQSTVLAVPTATPGYSNGESDYLNSAPMSMNASRFAPPGCSGQPLSGSLITPSGSGIGMPPYGQTFSFETACGTNPVTVQWTFGDGTVATQSSYNWSYITGFGAVVYDWNYTHTYHYIGSFVAYVNATDSVGGKADASGNVYASFVPSLFYTFYNESGLITKGLSGNRYAIGLTETCDAAVPTTTYTSDLSEFDTNFGLRSASITYVGPGVSSCSIYPQSGPVETDLDVQWAHVAAPGAKIYVCLDNLGTVAGIENCDQIFYQHRESTSYNTMIVSNSWGFCAYGNAIDPTTGASICINGPDPYSSNWSLYQQAGMNYVSATGDFAPDACAYSNYPASNLYGIAVGGTTVASVGSRGAYGSERAWWESFQANQCWYTQKGNVQKGNLGETYGTSGYYAAPSWQTSLLGNTYRYFPDVLSIGNSSTGVPIVVQGSWMTVGGTSVGAPVWSGILDIFFQAGAPGLSGFAAPFLYSAVYCFHVIYNHSGTRDGLGTPNIGCLSTA
jgi:subtilase family serine protease